MSSYWRESLEEFWRSHVSKAGIILLLIMIGISIYVVATYPLDYGVRYWSNPGYWADNPKLAEPEWVQYFTSIKLLKHTVLRTPSTPITKYINGVYYKCYNITYMYDADQFPTFLAVKVKGVVFHSTPPDISVYLITPDRRSVKIAFITIPSPPKNTSPPYVFAKDDYYRYEISGNPDIAKYVILYLYNRYNVTIPRQKALDIGYERLLFGIPHVFKNGSISFTPHKGKYIISFVLTTKDPRDKLTEGVFIIGGHIYGLMGTDIIGRDLAQGLIFGFPVALLIGVLTSVLTSIIGAVLGIISGYKGGLIDEAIQRICDIMNNIPLLPLFILIMFIVSRYPGVSKLGVIMALLVIFGWPGLTILVRSMVLPLRESAFVESAKAIGASSWRIMMRHIFLYVAPYVIAQMIFFTPSAILTEAALSFLGLGDPTIPTWGQILELGFRNGAIYLGYWWWIVPPGVLIVFSAITFVLIALGLEPVVNPRLRRRR